MAKADGIKARWSTGRKFRTARVGDLQLVATNGAISKREYYARWAVFLTDGNDRVLMAEGTVQPSECGIGHRYNSFERMAMYRAEQAAAAIR